MEDNFDEIAAVRAKSEELAAVKEMASTRGWAIILAHFKIVIQAVKEQLEVEEDFNRIKRLQERLRAFKSMLETVDAYCDEHSKVILQLDDMETEHNEREQYGQT